MRYRVVAVGRMRDAALRAVCDSYLQRLRRYTKVDEREVKAEARILEAVAEGSCLVALAEQGDQWTSAQLADWTARWELEGRDVTFALGGCDGHVAEERPLGEGVREMTVAAAREDPRCPPVEPEELPRLALEISVLTAAAPRPLDPVDPARIVIGRDGLIVRRGRHVGLLLPQVAAEYHWGPETFLAAGGRKAGLAPDAWRAAGTEVVTFQADVFGETGAAGRGRGEA